MHQFLDVIPENPSSTENCTPGECTKTYADYMTIINGIDTNRNVSHDAGAVISACGKKIPGIGNGTDLTTAKGIPSIEVTQ